MNMEKNKVEQNDIKKEYLGGYERALHQMERSEMRIEEIRLRKMSPSNVLDGMPRASGHKDLSGYAAILDQEERKYMKARYLRIKLCSEISDKIERQDNEDEKNVLMCRYIKLMKWEDISERLGFSLQHIHRIHSKGIKNFKM